MNLTYHPLLHIQRELQGMARNYARFQQYLRTIINDDGSDLELVPLVAANPMAKDHVTALLDALLAMDADGMAARLVAKTGPQLAEVPGDWNVSTVVVDDLMGGWTNRFDYEFNLRFGAEPAPKKRNYFWITVMLWSSEPASEQGVREAVLTMLHRLAHVHRHGPARTLRERMAQEGRVMALAGSAIPSLDEEDLAYTREVLTEFLDATDNRTTIECLFGDAAGKTLGFTPRGLSPWAGLALALHDARMTFQ